MIKLPDSFVERTKSLLQEEYEAFEKALQEPPPISVRVNDKIPNYQPSNEKVAWCSDGYYLAERPLFTADPLLHAGTYYVQEASSMFLNHIAQSFFLKAETVLELCAAPGGKSTLLSQALSPEALLVSNEIVTSRAHILAENLIKWGNPNVVVTNNAPKAFSNLISFFDVLVIDAPCSGEGMFRKDPQAIAEWSVQNVKNCAIRQKDILQDSWNCLKEGGLLVYSTCTYNREENEDNVEWAMQELGAEFLQVDISQFDGIVKTDYGYRFYPHRIKGEGFFISVLQKSHRKTATSPRKMKVKNQYKDVSSQYQHYLRDPESFLIYEINQEIIAFPKHNYILYQYLRENLNCLLSGLVLADKKVKNLIPTHQLALSKNLNYEAFGFVEVDYKTAISYLRRESIFLVGNYQSTYILLRYQHQILGWVKNLGHRFNNMYPQQWRIKMQL